MVKSVFTAESMCTSILNAIHMRTGLVTLYGQTAGRMPETVERRPSDYNLRQFTAFTASRPERHTAAAQWRTLVPGRATGMPVGGYLANTIFAAATGQLVPEAAEDLVLFIEIKRKKMISIRIFKLIREV